jgi:hypothetical protein
VKELRAAPKPAKPVRGTKAASAYMGLVAQLPCVVCRRFGVQVHHVIMGRGSQGRSSDFDTIPLCKPCHDSLHNNPTTWRMAYGPDHSFIEPTRRAVDALRARTV